jgi:UDP-N-acetylmuramate dehydrogenase
LNFPSAGSTFKNPAGNKAGLLLEQAGAKEFQVGQAAVSNLHANFVINLGGAVSQDVVSLLAKMQEAVYNANAIHLEPEWKILGDFTKEELSVWEAKEKACKSKS